MQVTKLTSGLFVLSVVEEEELSIAPVAQLQQRVLVHCFTCFLMVQRDLQKSKRASRCVHSSQAAFSKQLGSQGDRQKSFQCICSKHLRSFPLALLYLTSLVSASELAPWSVQPSMQQHHKQTHAQHCFSGQEAVKQACSAVVLVTACLWNM